MYIYTVINYNYFLKQKEQLNNPERFHDVIACSQVSCNTRQNIKLNRVSSSFIINTEGFFSKQLFLTFSTIA